MHDSSANLSPSAPLVRPFVGGREPARTESSISGRPRPFSPATRSSAPPDLAEQGGTPAEWAVAVYQPGMTAEVGAAPAPAVIRAPGVETAPTALGFPPAEDALTAPGLPLAEPPAEAIAAAELIESVARRLRQGHIHLAPGASLGSEAAIVASVLLALLTGAAQPRVP